MRPELERYEVVGELGQGGMSIVYRARDKQLSRDVALKVLHDFLAKQPDARRRFHREAVAVAKLHHPGILEIFDYSGPDAEQAFIVTELIEGKTLRAFITDHGPPRFPELGVLVVVELVRALRHAHEQGVVHRDLKPENIMITTTGQLKLMDFGIAQIMGGATKLTATGTLLGSPAHMAPEVIDGKISDHRSDIFSIGTILYWLCAGQLPFEAPNPSALFRKILEGTYEPPQMLEPKIGNGLARIIERALAPDLEERYQDVSLLEQDLLGELEEAELEPPAYQCKRFLLDPKGFADELEPALVERLIARGEEALEEGNVGRAMDRFNRVLAIDPRHEKARALTARLGRKERRLRLAKQAAAAGALLSLAGLGVVGAMEWVGSAPAATDRVPATAAQEQPAKVKPVMAPDAGTSPATVKNTPPDEGPVLRAAEPKPVRAEVAPAKKVRLNSRRRLVKPPPPKAEPPSKVVEGPDPKETPPETPPAVMGRVTIRIGSGFADVYVDGARLAKNAYLKELELTPGRHEVFVEKPRTTKAGVPGRHAARVLEVDDEGGVWLVRNGRRGPAVQEISFRVARTPEDIARNPADFRGWTSY